MRTETLNYGSKKKLYLLPNGMNRPVTSHHVNELVTSIKKYGNIRKVVVIEVDFLENEKRTYIVDGQHLREALNKCELGVDLIYVSGIKTRKDVIDLVAKLNNTSKPWGLEDYVQAWFNCEETSKAYKTLREYKEKFKLGYSTIAMLCNPYSPNRSTKILKNGELTITNPALTRTLLENISEVFTLIDKGYASEVRVLVMGYTSFYLQHYDKNATYNHTKFMNLLRQHKSYLNQYMHNPVVCANFLMEVYKGGKITRVAVPSKAGSPKKQPVIITLQKKN